MRIRVCAGSRFVLALFVSAGIVLAAFAAPPARAGDGFSEQDVELGRAAWKMAENRSWAEAIGLAAKASEPLVGKLFRWLYLTRPDNQDGFDATAAFLAENGNWPSKGMLRRRAEEALDGTEPADKMLEWFTRFPPLSTVGKIRYAEALLAAGRRDEAIPLLRKGWIEGDLGRVQEEDFFRRHSRFLTADDHVKRLDRLVWDGRIPEALRMLTRVDTGYRRLAEARLALREMKGNIDGLVNRVPEALRKDPGLAFDRALWRRRKGRMMEAREIVLRHPDPTAYQVIWWRERNFLARNALEQGHISEAYRLAAGHGMSPGETASFAEAEWLAGWIALRFLDEKEAARRHFERMYNVVTFSISRSRAAYWAGRAAKAVGDKEEARAWFEKAVRYSTTYYGQLAALQLDPGAVLAIPALPAPADDTVRGVAALEPARLAHFLQRVGAETAVKTFIFATADIKDTPEWKTVVARYAISIGRIDLAVSLARRVGQQGFEVFVEGYPVLTPPPLPPTAGIPSVETGLILSVVRQESTFDVDARSSAGARGLMQLMPKTATKVAGSLDVSHTSQKLTEDPEHNLLLGHAYLAKVVQEFSGSYVLALSAYNAGPSRARAWMRANGDPRDPAVDPVDWVELIPFSETRNYVQRVLENLQVYRARLAGQPVPLCLEKDLRR